MDADLNFDYVLSWDSVRGLECTLQVSTDLD